MVRLRFAPSPTGPLHIGGVRTALFNYLIVKNLGGQFILRIDDTDKERSLPEYEKNIIESLKWLGLSWDEGPDVGGPYGPYRQSEKVAKYAEKAEILLSKGFAYYDEEKVLRLKYPFEELVVHDLVCGDCKFNPRSLGPEPALLRSDGTPTYHLASVVDDMDMEITHVIRGGDHLTNTAKHLVIFKGLGYQPPKFAHLPIVLGQDGTKLSKRNSSGMSTVADFRDAGYLPHAVLNFLMLLGWSHPEAKEHLALEDAAKAFTIERVQTTPATFDVPKLDWLNGHWLRELPAEEVANYMLPFVQEYNEVISRLGNKHWIEIANFIRQEVGNLKEVPDLAKVIFSVEHVISEEGKNFLQTNKTDAALVVKELLNSLNEISTEDGNNCYSKELFSKIMNQLKKKVPVKGAGLFKSIRVALTGNVSGPELNVIVPLMEREVLMEHVKDTLKIL